MKRNHRLRFACELCEKLGIDDPVTWLNAVPPKVLDLWIALADLRAEEREGKGDMMDPAQAFKTLSEAYG